jgi:hypothetical protein
VRQALVEQFVNLTIRRLATVLADRTAHGGQEPQLGIDGRRVAHARSLGPCAGGRTSPWAWAPAKDHPIDDRNRQDNSVNDALETGDARGQDRQLRVVFGRGVAGRLPVDRNRAEPKTIRAPRDVANAAAGHKPTDELVKKARGALEVELYGKEVYG